MKRVIDREDVMAETLSPLNVGLDKNRANYVPLTPISFLAWTALAFPDRVSVIHGTIRYTWAETYARSRRLASALAGRGIGKDDVVAVMAPNIPAMYEAHFGVIMCGAVLNTLNTRLDPPALAFILRHSGAKALLCDGELAPVMSEALRLLDRPLLVIDIDDPLFPDGLGIGETTYEALLAEGDPNYDWKGPADEWDAIAVNYTSGTTGDPKGVVSHHRGAYLNALSNVMAWGMGRHAAYLWTLPMFHCNGWCFPWGVAAVSGVNICLRKIDAKSIFAAIDAHGVTHMCGAPIVFNMLVNAPPEIRDAERRPISGLVAGAAPPPALIEGAERIGFALTHVYGLTETYGPASICAPKEDWASLPLGQRADLISRQGIQGPFQEALTVLDPETLEPVPWDGETMGEVMFRGNIVMKGYLNNPSATARAMSGGWFHSGDLGVVYPDGYIKIRDRSKDIIISGGENISSLEVEETLYRHPAVLAAAVVAQPDEKWGESPCAFIELKDGQSASEGDIIAFCRNNIAHYKAPKRVVFRTLPKTSTGKIQKFVLREEAKRGVS